MKRIAVFASGGGTDFQSIIDANESERFCEIAYLIASKEGIGAIDRAQKHGISTAVFGEGYLNYFQKTPIPIWIRFTRN